jgi:plasmid replication initiation protein
VNGDVVNRQRIMDKIIEHSQYRNPLISHEIGDSKALLHSRYTMSKDEGRVLLMCLERMKRDGENAHGEYWFSASDYCDIFNITRREAVRDIKTAIDALAERWVHIMDGDQEISMRWIGKKMKNVKQGRYGIVFWPDILPFLHNLSDQLTAPLPWLAAMSNENNQRILRWINEARNIGKTSLEMTLDDIRYGLDIRESTSYQIYNNMKRRIIEPAVDNINSGTGLDLSFTEVKDSRRVVGLVFKWSEL